MNTTSSPRPTALDELLRRNPAINPEFLAQARKAADLLRELGLLSTEPAEVIRPFRRRPPRPTKTTGVNNWALPSDIRFDK